MLMKPLALLAGAALVLGACAAQPPDPMRIAEINVNADLTAVSSRNAAAYWRGLDTDLETAIATEFVGRLDAPGRTINVDVDELSLANALTTGLGPDDARLAGRVEVLNPDGTQAGVFDVTASTREAAIFLPPGTNVTTIPPSSTEFYLAVVQAFARGTADVVNSIPVD
jgi:hypothetical protein